MDGMRIKKKNEIVAIIDTREKAPLNLEKYGLKCVRDTIAHGDYTLRYPDLRNYLTIERKSLSDFIQCCMGANRERFVKELLCMRGYPFKFVVCEFSMADIQQHKYRSLINPKSVMASIASFMIYGIPFVMADNSENASYIVAEILTLQARRITSLARRMTDIKTDDVNVYNNYSYAHEL